MDMIIMAKMKSKCGRPGWEGDGKKAGKTKRTLKVMGLISELTLPWGMNVFRSTRAIVKVFFQLALFSHGKAKLQEKKSK